MRSLRQLWSDGYSAALAGQPITDCPLDRRTVTGRTWCDGWRAAKGEKPAQLPLEVGE